MQIHLRRLTAFAALAVGLMAQASPASAAFPDRETVAASSVSNSLDKGVTVTCPAGKRVVGSGADIGGYDLRVSVRNRAGARSDFGSTCPRSHAIQATETQGRSLRR